jgi:hypothetical protein
LFIRDDQRICPSFPVVAQESLMTDDESGVGEVLRSVRTAAGWSLSRMARATGYSKPYLSKLETGSKAVKPWHTRAYDQALGGDMVQRRALLLLGASVVGQAIWSELDLPVTPPRRLGAGDIDALEASADYLTGLGLRHGGLGAVAAAKGQLRYAAGMLDVTMTDHVRRRLLAIVARLADRTAWSMADVGQTDRAFRLYDFALSVTPDATQRWLTLVNIANLRLTAMQPNRAHDLLDRPDPDVPVLRFLVQSARAHSLAQLGAFAPTMRHLDLADAVHGRIDITDLPDAIRPYASGHGAHAHANAGRALHALARSGSKAAVPLATERLEAAIEMFGPERAHAVANCKRRLDSLLP